MACSGRTGVHGGVTAKTLEADVWKERIIGADLEVEAGYSRTPNGNILRRG